MIRRFTIEGFKRFQRETVIDLDDVTVLVGANNSGKSTILHPMNAWMLSTRRGIRHEQVGRPDDDAVRCRPATGIEPAPRTGRTVADDLKLLGDGGGAPHRLRPSYGGAAGRCIRAAEIRRWRVNPCRGRSPSGPAWPMKR